MPASSDTEDNLSTAASEDKFFEEEPIIRKIFIANVNSYHGKAIAKKLRDIKNYPSSPSGKLYEIYGSLEISDEIDNEVVENYAPRILDRKKPTYIPSILSCETIVYDIGMHTSQVVEAQKVLDMLEAKLKLCEAEPDDLMKYFILISTSMVWARTPILSPEDPNEPIVEADYRKRRPHPCYVKHHILEREVINAQSRHKGRLKTIVICPGVTYGGRNEIFHYIFKNAFYNKDSIEIFRQNRNEPQYLPMIYISDFAEIMFKIIEQFPPVKLRYIFAVQSKPITMKNFAVLVANSVTGNPIKVKIASKEEILSSQDTLITQRVYHYLALNLKFAPTYLKDFEFEFGEDLEAMGNTIANEYRRERNLLPIKIIVDGPPCAGKTTLSKALAEQYEVHYVDPKTAVFNVMRSLEQKINEAKMYLEERTNFHHRTEGGEEEESFAGDDSEDLINAEAALNEHIAEWEAELVDLTDYTTTIGNAYELDFDYIKKCLVEILDSKPCSENQGYVIDGFPFDYNETAEIFPTNLFRDEIEDGEEESIIAPPSYTHSMKPTYFVVLVAQDELLCKRAMSLTEREAVETNNTEPLMLARLAKYHERNEEDVSCANYFIDNGIVPIVVKISSDTTVEQVLAIVKKQIGPPHIYPMSRTQMDEMAKAELKERKLKNEEQRRIKEQIERDEEAAREAKLQEWTKKFELLKQQEHEILEAKSLPLRSYLSKYVLPILTEGLLKVAETKPDDPIDFLAEYLFCCNPTGHVLDPAYSEDAKRLLLNLDCGLDMPAAKANDQVSQHDSLECGDSFITRHFEKKAPIVPTKRKLVRAPKSTLPSSSTTNELRDKKTSKSKTEKNPIV